MRKITRTEIWTNTRKSSEGAGLFYIITLIFAIITVPAILQGASLLALVPMIFTLVLALASSRGYYLDLLLKRIQSIEGKGKLGESLVVSKKIYATYITVENKNERKKLRYCKKLSQKIEGENNKVKEGVQAIYYYLPLTKVIVDVEYIKKNKIK